MDKIAMKRLFAAASLPTPRFVAYRDGHDLEAFCRRAQEELAFPCFVKPANMGSSVGVSKARDAQQLRDAVVLAARYDEWVMVEEFIRGREIETAVLGDDPPEVSVPGSRRRTSTTTPTSTKTAKCSWSCRQRWTRRRRLKCASSRGAHSRPADARRWRASTSSCATTVRSS
jgi:hypothetical protein